MEYDKITFWFYLMKQKDIEIEYIYICKKIRPLPQPINVLNLWFDCILCILHIICTCICTYSNIHGNRPIEIELEGKSSLVFIPPKWQFWIKLYLHFAFQCLFNSLNRINSLAQIPTLIKCSNYTISCTVCTSFDLLSLVSFDLLSLLSINKWFDFLFDFVCFLIDFVIYFFRIFKSFWIGSFYFLVIIIIYTIRSLVHN